MDTNSWISLLTSKILKKPCKCQIMREKNETYTEQLLVIPCTQYLTTSTKK